MGTTTGRLHRWGSPNGYSPPTGDQTEVRFTNGDVKITFKLARIDGRWELTDQRQE